MKSLNRKQAIDLITPVVDNEVSQSEKIAFFEYIKKDVQVQQMYESEKRIKNLIRKSYKPVSAPSHLKDFVKKLPDYYGLVDIPDDEKSPFNQKSGQGNNRFRSYFIALAASILLVFGFYQFGYDKSVIQDDVYMEPISLIHYQNHKELNFPEPQFTNISLEEAENIIIEHYGKHLTVPYLSGAEFEGLFYTEFAGNHKTPLLRYRPLEEEKPIFIFAFNLDSVASHIHRNEEAIDACQKFEDYHILPLDDTYVVSWKWDNNWYTAVSPHKGEKIVAMLPIH